MSSTTEQIKERLPIEDVISSYIKLERSGRNLRARCPFHNEKTPSFFVSPDRGTYYCFGCGAKGDVFSFVSEFEGLDFRGALKVLAERAGVKIEKEDPRKQGEKEKLLEATEEATIFFQKNLSSNKEALSYLEERGLDPETMKNFRLGYAPESWRSLYEALAEKRKLSPKVLEQAGLVIKKEDGGYYDRFRGRIMFPLFDSSGRVIAFTGRVFPGKNDEKTAKYVNSPETSLFHKSKFLYGFHTAKNYIRKYDFSIVVEGQTDLLAAHQAGYKNTVATSGTALTKEHFELMNRLSAKVVLALDADEAGSNSAGRGAQEALALGMDVKVAKLPKGLDPAELLKEDKEAWKEAVKNSLHIVDFYLAGINDKELDERKRKSEIQKKVFPFIKAIDNKIDQAHFVKKISFELAIKEEAVYDELAKIKNENISGKPPVAVPAKTEEGRNRKSYIEERLRAIVLWQEKEEKPLIAVNEIKEKFNLLYGEEYAWPQSEGEKEDLIFQAEMLYGNFEELEEEVRELLKNLEEDFIKEDMVALMRELRRAELEEREGDAGKILEDYQKLLAKLAEINGKS